MLFCCLKEHQIGLHKGAGFSVSYTHLNLMPNTGVTLPFISYGGTSIVFLMAEMGLALRDVYKRQQL